MKLLRYAKGRYNPISMHRFASQKLTAHEVEECIRRNVNMDGSISALCLDFSGGYVPLVSEDEVRLAAALLCMYHNSLLPDEDLRPLPSEASLQDDDRRDAHEDAEGGEEEDEEEEENSGVSDDEEEKERLAALDFEYEINADIDGEPNFGKAGMEHHLW